MEDMMFLKRCNECSKLMNSFCYSYRRYDSDDIMQECRLAILDAMKRYDSSKNVSFTSFARDYMRSRVNDFVGKTKPIAMSRESMRKCNLVKKYVNEYNTFNISSDDLNKLNITKSEFDKFKYDYKFLNLDNKVNDESESTFSDMISDNEKKVSIYDVLDKYVLASGELSSDELDTFINITDGSVSETSVAAALGISRQAVAKRIKKYKLIIQNVLVREFGSLNDAYGYLRCANEA